MIKLSTFIPEIKIIPNLYRLKVGDKFRYTDLELRQATFAITHIGDINNNEYKNVSVISYDDDGQRYPYEMYYNELEKDLRTGKIKLVKKIDEIKIVPNRKYQVGDHFTHNPNLMINGVKTSQGENMVITAIKDGNVYYDTVDGYWADMDTVNFRTIEEFNRLVDSGQWVIIRK